MAIRVDEGHLARESKSIDWAIEGSKRRASWYCKVTAPRWLIAGKVDVDGHQGSGDQKTRQSSRGVASHTTLATPANFMASDWAGDLAIKLFGLVHNYLAITRFVYIEGLFFFLEEVF